MLNDLAVRPIYGVALRAGVVGIELGIKLAIGDAYRPSEGRCLVNYAMDPCPRCGGSVMTDQDEWGVPSCACMLCAREFQPCAVPGCRHWLDHHLVCAVHGDMRLLPEPTPVPVEDLFLVNPANFQKHVRADIVG